MAKQRAKSPMPCPCGSGLSFEQCCQPLLLGQKFAETAEQLMRSRYSAFTQQHWAYLRQTWHASTCPTELEDDHPPQWCGLHVLSHLAVIDNDENRSEVEFVARYKVNGRAFRLHERSRFVREAGQWWYVDGDFTES